MRKFSPFHAHDVFSQPANERYAQTMITPKSDVNESGPAAKRVSCETHRCETHAALLNCGAEY